MELRNLFGILTCATLVCGTAVSAADYQPGEVFRLDLSRAVLSPRPLGPEAHFEPVPIEARVGSAVVAAAQDKPDLSRNAPASKRRSIVRSAERLRTAREAMHRRSLLDAQAMDTRVQTWPCRPDSGGICNWR